MTRISGGDKMEQPTSHQGAGCERPHWALRLLIHALLAAAATLVSFFLGTQIAAAADGPSAPALTAKASAPKVSTAKASAPKASTAKASAETEDPAQVDRPVHVRLVKAVKALDSKRSVAAQDSESPSLPTKSAIREGVEPAAKALDKTAGGVATATSEAVEDVNTTLSRTSTEVDKAVTTTAVGGTADTATRQVALAVRDTLKVVDETVGGVVDPAVDDVVQPAVDTVRDVVGLPMVPPSLPTIPPLAPAVPDTSGTASSASLPVAEPLPAPAVMTVPVVEPVAAPTLVDSSPWGEAAGDVTAASSGRGDLSLATTQGVGASSGGPLDPGPAQPLLPGVAPASSGGSASGAGGYSPAGVVAGANIQYLPPTLAETDFQKSIATTEGVRPGQRPD